MPRRGGRGEKSSRYWIILIIPLFIGFLSPIYFNSSDSELKESEDGQLSSVDEEYISKSEKDSSEKDNKEFIITPESSLFELQNSEKIKLNNLALELTLLKQEVKKLFDLYVVKENEIYAQYREEIQTVKETMESQFDKIFNLINSLTESLKSLENDFGTFKNKIRELWTAYDELRGLERSAMQQIPNLENRIHKIEKNEEGNFEKIEQLSKQISDMEDKIQQLVERSNKESKENEVRGIMSNRVDILLICVIIILFIYIVIKDWRENSRKNGMEINRFRGGGKVPLVISFTENCKRSHEDLMREFTDSYDSLVMKNSRDIPQIHQIYSEVFLVFVDFNERNIILEGDREPQQIRKETVEYIRNMGRTAVVIYHLHPDSGTLEDGRLYSRKLTSIEYHPTLKQLSSRDCVLSIYRQFSEDQKARLKDICDL